MAIQVESLNAIDFTNQKTQYIVMGTVIEITYEPDPEGRKPLKCKIRFENSGETIAGVSWDSGILPLVRDALNCNNVYEIEFSPSQFKEEKNLKLTGLNRTAAISTKKVMRKEVSLDDIKGEITSIVTQYVHNSLLLGICNWVLSMPEFATWPAAIRIHHAYPGGLAKHTLGVIKICMSLYNNYKSLANLEMLITGALIHDIGKIYEYEPNGQISFAGSINRHITFGIAMLSQYAFANNIPLNDIIMLQLFGIISSHHGTLENGSPSTPATIEAVLVHFADNIDAGMENLIDEFRNLDAFGKSNYLKALDTYAVKIDNKTILNS